MSQLNANSLVDRIRAGTKNRSEICWPGTDASVWIRVLSKSEIQDATFAADQRFRVAGVPVEAHTIETYKDEETLQILYRSLSDEAGKPVTNSVDAFRILVTTDVQTELAKAYRAHEDEVSPSLEKMSAEDFDVFVKGLRKNAEATIGCVSNIVTARKLLRSLVAQLPN